MNKYWSCSTLDETFQMQVHHKDVEGIKTCEIRVKDGLALGEFDYYCNFSFENFDYYNINDTYNEVSNQINQHYRRQYKTLIEDFNKDNLLDLCLWTNYDKDDKNYIINDEIIKELDRQEIVICTSSLNYRLHLYFILPYYLFEKMKSTYKLTRIKN